MRTRETEWRLSLGKDTKEKLADAIELSIKHCDNKIDGKSEGKFPLCLMFTGSLGCTPCPVNAATGACCSLIQYEDYSLLRTQAMRRHFRRFHWKAMKRLLMEIRDMEVGI